MKLALMTAVAALLFTGTASAHLVRQPDFPKKTPLENRLASQQENLAHALYVCHNGKRQHRAWGCWAASSVVRPNGQGWLRRELRKTISAWELTLDPFEAVRYVFPSSEWGNAIAVMRCETGGTFSVWAENGQFENVFQMGESERAKYGWHTKGSPAILAVKAAYGYWSDSGWHPWQCLPSGGLRW